MHVGLVVQSPPRHVPDTPAVVVAANVVIAGHWFAVALTVKSALGESHVTVHAEYPAAPVIVPNKDTLVPDGFETAQFEAVQSFSLLMLHVKSPTQLPAARLLAPPPFGQVDALHTNPVFGVCVHVPPAAKVDEQSPALAAFDTKVPALLQAVFVTHVRPAALSKAGAASSVHVAVMPHALLVHALMSSHVVSPPDASPPAAMA